MLNSTRCFLLLQQNACFQQSRPLMISVLSLGKNPYTEPTRTIILKNEDLEQKIKLKSSLSDIDTTPTCKEIEFVNRNPRHFDLLGWNKPVGFTTLYEKRQFFNNLRLEMTNKHTKAYVENINREILCYASTAEFYITKRLHSTTDVPAVVNVARVLAERCKQVGIQRVHWHTRFDRSTEKIREFEGILRNAGIELSEMPVRVLHGPSQTLPLPRKKRKMPGPMKAGEKRQGTIGRKGKNDWINEITLLD